MLLHFNNAEETIELIFPFSQSQQTPVMAYYIVVQSFRPSLLSLLSLLHSLIHMQTRCIVVPVTMGSPKGKDPLVAGARSSIFCSSSTRLPFFFLSLRVGHPACASLS